MKSDAVIRVSAVVSIFGCNKMLKSKRPALSFTLDLSLNPPAFQPGATVAQLRSQVKITQRARSESRIFSNATNSESSVNPSVYPKSICLAN
jgi:hypothetical protein